jgi:hypothetical protein
MEDHIVVPIKATGGKVVILNTHSTISAEDLAMLQALYSRDPASIESHLSRVGNHASGKKTFMETYYVGYGHESIGDCASITFFIEGISMIAAKAIQDTRLYSGQEVSTRYVDYSKQRFLFGGEIVEKLRKFYVESFPIVEEEIQKKGDYSKNAVRAATFDILRGFLPAGAETSCSWTTNIRQANNHIAWLRGHPLEEIKSIADALTEALKKYAPNSVTPEKIIAPEFLEAKINMKFTGEEFSFVKLGYFEETKRLLNLRKPKDPIANFLDSGGSLSYVSKLDYGSYRDLQRHRSIIQNSPLPRTKYGFEEFYLESLPDSIKLKARELLICVEKEAQAPYEVPLGYKIPIIGNGGIASMIYIAEIRSNPTVHPTLQAFAKKIGGFLEENDIRVYYNKDPVTHISQKRGTQTITLNQG